MTLSRPDACSEVPSRIPFDVKFTANKPVPEPVFQSHGDRFFAGYTELVMRKPKMYIVPKITGWPSCVNGISSMEMNSFRNFTIAFLNDFFIVVLF